MPNTRNWIDAYDFTQKFLPHLLPKLHMAHGNGKLTKFCQIMGATGTYASDEVKHAEQGRLHNKLRNVTLSGAASPTRTFTFTPTPTQATHNVRVNDTVLVFDGTSEYQATVTSIISPTSFTATNNQGTNMDVTNTCDVVVDFANSFAKGANGFSEGRKWEPNIHTNYSHIIKEYYDINNSDMAHTTWINTPNGPMWYNFEMENTSMLFDNKVELAHLLWKRKASGNDRGMNGLVPTIENRGNIVNEYIETIADLDAISLRMKRQGVTAREFTIWCDFEQMVKLRNCIAGVNAHFAAGANYGIFNNKKDNAIALGFSSINIGAYTYHFAPLDLLDDPTLLGTDHALATSIAAIIVPGGSTNATIEGNSSTVPYFSIKSRVEGKTNRRRVVNIKGNDFANLQDGNKDITTMDFLSEQTQQLVGANAFVVVRRGMFY
jgi:hypothetical protein